MDLTSASQALKSLRRRGMSEEACEAADKLVVLLESNCLASQVAQPLGVLLKGEERWEQVAAGLLTASDILKGMKESESEWRELWEMVETAVETNLEHREPRVRSCVVKAVESLASKDGPKCWVKFGPVLCNVVEKSFTLDEEERIKTHSELAMQEAQRKIDKTSIPHLVHETIGWKALETSMRGLEALVRGYGPGFAKDGHLAWNNGYIVDLAANRGLLHENRYVREVTYDLCGVIASAVCGATNGSRNEVTDAIARAVTRGLQDNWSQVRFAASVAARNLVLGLIPEQREAYLDDLVPRMCLNRYYLAEGVKLYSQETWRLAFPGEGGGVQAVCAHIGPVVAYYCEQSRADNHGVREAACYCIAELSAKVPKEVLSAQVDELLKALVECFRDDSWPVRDAACVATGRFVTNFPTESKSFFDELTGLWFDHLSDNIWSVREDSATALGNAMVAYPDEGVSLVKSRLPELLQKVHEKDHVHSHAAEYHAEEDPHLHHHSEEGSSPKDISMGVQAPIPPSSPRTMAGAESVPRMVVTGSLKELHNRLNPEEVDPHANQQMFSCGSLAPKLKRRGVGCMDHGYTRPKKNWEITDGGIYLLREFVRLFPEQGGEFMEQLAKVTQTEYAGIDLHVTLWKQLTLIAKAMGKRPFKRYLELFLPSMISDLQHDSQLVATAAADCLMFLMQFVGPNILQGRVEQLLGGDRLWRTVVESPLIVI